MANEDKKDFNKKMNDSKNMPKIVELDEEASKKWGGKTMVVAPPLDYDKLIRKVTNGKLITTNEMRKALAKKYNVEITCPLTAGIFTNICAWASFQREKDKTPFWRVVKTNGELNQKFPDYPKLQKEFLEKEGFEIIQKKEKYFVKDFDKYIIDVE